MYGVQVELVDTLKKRAQTAADAATAAADATVGMCSKQQIRHEQGWTKYQFYSYKHNMLRTGIY
jgi:hypothetical protein